MLPGRAATVTGAASRGPAQERLHGERAEGEGEDDVEAQAEDADDQHEDERPQERAGIMRSRNRRRKLSQQPAPHARAARIVVEVAGAAGVQHGGELAAVGRVQAALQRQPACCRSTASCARAKYSTSERKRSSAESLPLARRTSRYRRFSAGSYLISERQPRRLKKLPRNRSRSAGMFSTSGRPSRSCLDSTRRPLHRQPGATVRSRGPRAPPVGARWRCDRMPPTGRPPAASPNYRSSP